MPQGKKKKQEMLKQDRRERVAMARLRRALIRYQSRDKLDGKKK